MMAAAADVTEYRAILRACRKLRKPRGNYLDNDFVSALVDTVIDYRLNETITGRAYKHFEDNHWDRLRTCTQLCSFLKRFPDTKQGNARGARSLWGYGYGERFRQLRRLVAYFQRVGVKDRRTLRRWAHESSFERDFKGQVRGLAFAVYKWLLMRVGVETVKPDSRLKRFLRRVTGRDFSDDETVSVLEQAAREIGWKAYILDWAIWEAEGERSRS
jgi:hypothetical protein